MSDGTGLSRRRLLRAAGVGSFGVFVGGLLIHNPTTLRHLGVWNERDQRERIEVRVIAGGETYVERFFEVGGNARIQIPCEWPNPGGTYRYGARLEGAEAWTEATISDGGDAYRRIWIMEDGVGLTATSPSDPAESFPDRCEVPWWVDEFRSG